MKLPAKEIPQKKIIITNRTNLKKNEKNEFFLSMYFSYPFFIKFYYFYSAIVALKGLSNFFIVFWPTIETREFQREKKYA